MNVSGAALRQVPFIRPHDVGNRVVNLMPVWEGGRWTLWIPLPGNKMIETHPQDVQSAHYLAKAAASPTDLHFPFMDFLWQRASWRDAIGPALAIADDFDNLASSLAKIDFFWEHRARQAGVAEFVKTEIEYLLVVCRSILDHLQEVLAAIWDHIALLDAAAQRQKRQLPKSMARMALKGDDVIPAADLDAKYRIPAPVGHFYESLGPFFRGMRAVRDAVVHEGRSNGIIFVVERGFGISRESPLYGCVNEIWVEAHYFNENVVSLRPFLAYVVLRVLSACTEAIRAFDGVVQFPPEIAPEFRVFIRATHGPALLRAQNALNAGAGWWENAPAAR